MSIAPLHGRYQVTLANGQISPQFLAWARELVAAVNSNVSGAASLPLSSPVYGGQGGTALPLQAASYGACEASLEFADYDAAAGLPLPEARY